MRINLSDVKNKTLRGKVVNMITNDAKNLEGSFVFFHTLITCPINVCASIIILVYQLGWESILALVFVVAALALNILIGRINIKFK